MKTIKHFIPLFIVCLFSSGKLAAGIYASGHFGMSAYQMDDQKKFRGATPIGKSYGLSAGYKNEAEFMIEAFFKMSKVKSNFNGTDGLFYNYVLKSFYYGAGIRNTLISAPLTFRAGLVFLNQRPSINGVSKEEQATSGYMVDIFRQTKKLDIGGYLGLGLKIKASEQIEVFTDITLYRANTANFLEWDIVGIRYSF